jgi:hypothetical protein
MTVDKITVDKMSTDSMTVDETIGIEITIYKMTAKFLQMK